MFNIPSRDIYSGGLIESDSNMNPYWSPVVSRLDPYVPGEQPKIEKLLKLNTNESPYCPSPAALAAMAAEARDSLRLYPDPNADELRSTIAELNAVETNQVFVGNGSDEVLAHAFRGLMDHGEPVLFPDISYSFYPVYCGLFELSFTKVPLDENFRLRPQDYSGAKGGIIFPNPNAPTGIGLEIDAVEQILTSNPDCVVVVDEAYVDFGADSAVPLIGKYPNLLVIQTLSKSRALAGLRVGFAIGDAGLIEALERVKNSFNSYPLNRFALAGAVASIRDREYFEKSCTRVIADREQLSADLEGLGFEVLPSLANFVFARHLDFSGADLAARLRETGILVRNFQQPRIADFLRITVGTEEQCERLTSTLQDLLDQV